MEEAEAGEVVGSAGAEALGRSTRDACSERDSCMTCCWISDSTCSRESYVHASSLGHSSTWGQGTGNTRTRLDSAIPHLANSITRH